MSVLFYIFKFVWNKKLLARYNLRRFQSSDNTKNRVSSCSRSSLSLSDRLTHILAPSLSHTQKHPISLSLSLYRSLPLSLSFPPENIWSSLSDFDSQRLFARSSPNRTKPSSASASAGTCATKRACRYGATRPPVPLALARRVLLGAFKNFIHSNGGVNE